MVIKIHDRKIIKFRNLLLDWGKDNLRDFKWRNSSNPYEVIVAEMMLQRTKAEQIENVYTKFLEKFPDVKTLADADTESIEEVIAPLGLRYRAERMKIVAEKIVKLYDSSIPESENELLKLPGIGNYIAGIVVCLAFKKDVPIFDSNVARIVARIFSINVTVESHKKRDFWVLMETMLPSGKSREFNLALIDLGSLICTPKNPLHEKCPLNMICNFYKKSRRAR